MLFKSSFLSSHTYHGGEDVAANDSEAAMSSSSKASSNNQQLYVTHNSNNTLFETIKVELDTQSLLLLGLLYCQDRNQQKASVLYSIMRGASPDNL